MRAEASKLASGQGHGCWLFSLPTHTEYSHIRKIGRPIEIGPAVNIYLPIAIYDKRIKKK